MDDNVNPYASPPEADDGSPILAGLAGPYSATPYASARTRAGWAGVLLWIILVGSVISAGSGWLQIQLLHRISSGTFTRQEITWNTARQRLIGLVLQGASLGSMVSFLMWFHRVNRNLPSLGTPSPRFTPGWAVGWWFVPVFSLVRPYQAMREIWHGSDPAAAPSDGLFRRLPASGAVVGWWWALFLIMNLVGTACMQVGIHSQSLDLEGLIFLSWLGVVDALITVPAALLAITVVRQTTANQEERHRLLTQGGTTS